MLAPEELQVKRFTKMFHGYNPEEVDEQIAFLLEQYTAMYRENDELERKLRIARAQLNAYEGGEESIRRAVIEAENTSERLLRDARERAKAIDAATKQTCRQMIHAAAVKVQKQNEVLNQLKKQTAAFKKLLLTQYADQLELIEHTAESDRDTDLEEFADEAIVGRIIAGIKEEAAARPPEQDRTPKTKTTDGVK